MTPGEQAHSLRVWRWLQAQGHHQPELQQAALLHDVGKSVAPLNIVERVLIVLGFRFFHRLASQWSRSQTASGWRKPFVVAARHPAWGADLAAKAGAAPTVVHLIRRHQSPCPPDDHLLHHLQLADEQS
jgi:hypothetical protein